MHDCVLMFFWVLLLFFFFVVRQGTVYRATELQSGAVVAFKLYKAKLGKKKDDPEWPVTTLSGKSPSTSFRVVFF